MYSFNVKLNNSKQKKGDIPPKVALDILSSFANKLDILQQEVTSVNKAKIALDMMASSSDCNRETLGPMKMELNSLTEVIIINNK